MDFNSTYDIALRIGEIAMRSLQFFILVCTAFGGWVLAGETIIQLDPLAPIRFVIAGAFSAAAIGITYGTNSTIGRLNAALELSKEQFENENGEVPKSAKKMFDPGNIIDSYWAMIGVIVFLNVVIVLYDCTLITIADNKVCG